MQADGDDEAHREERHGEVEGLRLEVLIARALREGRRREGLSQRALAERSGVHQSTIARLEAGAEGRLTTAAQVLAAVRLRLGVLDEGGQEVVVPRRPSDEGRDTGGRRLPAHLDVERSPWLPSWTFTRRMIAGTAHPLRREEPWIFHRRPPREDGG
jgi:transcriptional regulator with XRE-family HTH domain